MVYRDVMGLAPDLVERFARAADVIREPEQLRTYECDGLTGRRVVPALVALPADAAQVQAVVRICNDAGVPFVARGAGTGLSGGALPVAEGIVISLARMDRVLRGYPYAKAAIEFAAYDLAGRQCGLPVHRLLGGASRRRIPVTHSIGLIGFEEAEREVAQTGAGGGRLPATAQRRSMNIHVEFKVEHDAWSSTDDG